MTRKKPKKKKTTTKKKKISGNILMSLSQTLKIFSQWGDSYSRKSSTDVTLMKTF